MLGTFLTKRPICTENNKEPSNPVLFIFKTCYRHSRFFIDDNDFPELDLNKTFYYIHIKEIPGGLSSENIYQNDVQKCFSGFLRNSIHCVVHNCEDHSSFDFISAVLLYNLFHIHLPKHDIFTCETYMLSSRRAFRCEN